MKCSKCRKELDVTQLDVRKDSICDRSGEQEVEVGMKCERGADYAMFVSASELCPMN